MSLFGGKRKVNKGLKDWVTFVKKVQKEENISYKDAIHRAKERKDKGEKWMSGGGYTLDTPAAPPNTHVTTPVTTPVTTSTSTPVTYVGGKKRRTMRKSKSTKRKMARRCRSRRSSRKN